MTGYALRTEDMARRAGVLERYRLLKCDFGKASELARMQALGFLVLETFERLQADLEMLTDASPVEFAGHAGEFDFAVQRLVGDAQQGAVGDAEAIAVGGNRRGLHVERDGAGLRQPSNERRATDFPIAIVDAGNRSGAHHPLELKAGQPGHLADRFLQR